MIEIRTDDITNHLDVDAVVNAANCLFWGGGCMMVRFIGVYCFPKELAAKIALETVLANLTVPSKKCSDACFSESDSENYRTICAKISS